MEKGPSLRIKNEHLLQIAMLRDYVALCHLLSKLVFWISLLVTMLSTKWLASELRVTIATLSAIASGAYLVSMLVEQRLRKIFGTEKSLTLVIEIPPPGPG